MHKTSLRQKIALILLGVFLCLFLLELGLRLGEGVFLILQEQRNAATTITKRDYRILCLGESTTAFGGKYSWPEQLEKELNRRNLKMKFKVINKGRPAAETTAILSFLRKELDKYKPDMVITMMGVNDDVATAIYSDLSGIKIRLFFERMRIYRLAKLIQAHIMNRIAEAHKDKTARQRLSQEAPRHNKWSPIQKKADSRNKELLKSRLDICVDAGYGYYKQGKYDMAVLEFKRALEIDHRDARAYIGLGQSYREQGEIEKMGTMAREAIVRDPYSEDIYVLMGQFYLEEQRFNEAEKMFKKAIELNPRYEPAYTDLGVCYRRQGKIKQIQNLSQKIRKERVNNDRLYGFIGTVYLEEGNYDEAERYYSKANEFRLKYYNHATRHNYQILKERLAERNIRIVCVQYPMRSVRPLEKNFDSPRGIIFVDNEKVFKDALKKYKYDELFEDNFGGEFGHATPLGNKILAENIANILIKQVFKKHGDSEDAG